MNTKCNATVKIAYQDESQSLVPLYFDRIMSKRDPHGN